MRQIKEIMRLRYELNCSQQKIANASGIARSTVKDYLMRAKVAGLGWPLPEEMSNEKLNELLFPPKANKSSEEQTMPDWAVIHKELKRKSVTLQLLWEEYKSTHPQGYQYSWFAHLYRQWAKRHNVWMPQTHKAGEKVFVDYSGLTVPIWSTNLRDIVFKAEIFVSVLGASDLIYCVATKTQQIPDWIESHNRLFQYYGGVVELIIPDNLRTGVTRAHRYEPQCQLTYEEFAQHYHCAIMPARAYHPKDKSRVEKGVQLVQQRVLAPLRDEQFCSLEQLNKAMAEQLELLNERYSKTFGCSRRTLFEEVEQSALKPLPKTPYEIALWEGERVNGGYHVSVHRHYYSVPHCYVNKKVDIRITEATIEIFYRDERIASHRRDDTPMTYTTVDAHRPEAHRQYAQWTVARLQAWSAGIGCATEQFIHELLSEPKRHLYQKERSALGILRLSNSYSDVLLEKACQQALSIKSFRYDSVLSLINREKNKTPPVGASDQCYETPDHNNVRGPQYYH